MAAPVNGIEKSRPRMPRFRDQSTFRRLQIVIGLGLAGLFYAQFELGRHHNPVIQRGTVVLGDAPIVAERFEMLVRTDPLAALLEARDLHGRSATAYTCNFVKQEVLSSGMGPEQEIEVLHRMEPYSVVLNWLRNPKMAQRVIYVKNRWIDKDADKPEERELAVVRPIAPYDLLLKSLKQPIRGKNAKEYSRRCIDEFGFTRSLDLLIEYRKLANSRGELKLEFMGESTFDGRPTWVIRRHLPYEKEGGRYPDRIAEIYLDKEYRVPVAVYCYASDEMKPEDLLGKYEYRNIKCDAALTDADFEPATYGM